MANITWRPYACTKMKILIKGGKWILIRKATEESEHTWLPFSSMLMLESSACSPSSCLPPLSLSLSLSIYIYVDIYMCVRVCVCVYQHIFYAYAWCMAAWLMRNVYGIDLNIMMIISKRDIYHHPFLYTYILFSLQYAIR